jgi:tetratricopeptide (TPR) repeat protein
MLYTVKNSMNITVPVKKFSVRKYFIYTLLSIFLVLTFVYYLPFFGNYAGDIFFGRVPKLYNVTLANFFFKQAAYPIFQPPIPYAHHQLSRTYFIQGHLGNALYEARKELEFYPDDKKTYYILGLTLGFMNKEDAAIDAFTKYLEYNPKSWAGRNDKAWLQFRIGDIDGAITTIVPVATVYPNNVWVQNTYCALMINKKKYQEAKDACTRAKKAASSLTETSWGKAYPGNDPRIYSTGLSATRKSVDENLHLLEGK